MSFPLAAASFIVIAALLWYLRRPQTSIAHLPGPPSHSWLVGNTPDFDRAKCACDADFEWTKKYGNVFRFKKTFGEDVLFVSDPKALQYILNKSGYNFPKSPEDVFRTAFVTGRGIVTVDGAQHARQRRVITPSFSHSALKGFFPLFLEFSQKTTSAWRALILKQNTKACVINVSSLLARTTLDIIGEVAFGYKFGAIDAVEPKTELHKAYHNLFSDTGYMRSDFEIVFTSFLVLLPPWFSSILASLPLKGFQRFKIYMAVARKVARDLLNKELHAQVNGKEGGKDLMSLVIKANNTEDPRRRLSEGEILPQITTFMLAGHETTASTLCWILYEISKHPEVQHKLHEEIQALRSEVSSRGDKQITIQDMDSLKYMIAVMKETLRYHPIVMQLGRRALHDDVIPLDTPQQTVTGETITAIPVRKGQSIQVGIASYNRLEAVWGEDADKWNPERFFEEHNESKTNLGVYANLSTFSSGLRSCIAWRFALVEMQTVLIELIENFEFSLVPGVEIKRVASGIMQSMVKGEEIKGAQLPLTVSIRDPN